MEQIGEFVGKVLNGDCREVLKQLPDNSIDAVVCDPPYELGFMNKGWDKSGIAYDHEVWTQVLRVLKPGGHLLAFGGTRTYHRLASAIEDAGFEIRDMVEWLYGKGFPKSQNVSLMMDKRAGAEREVSGVKPGHEDFAGRGNTSSVTSLSTGTMSGPGGFARPWMRDQDKIEKYHMATEPATENAKKWDGWGTALKPAHEPICMARKPLSEDTVVDNVLRWGTGALNIDLSRIASPGENPSGERRDGVASRSMGWRNATPAKDFDRVAASFKQQRDGERLGRWPANVALAHHPDCALRGTKRVKNGSGGITGNEPSSKMGTHNIYGVQPQRTPWTPHGDADGTELVEDWACVEDCPIRLLDEQTGDIPGTRHEKPCLDPNIPGQRWGTLQGNRPARGYADNGGASRFFYTAKAPNSERWLYCKVCSDAFPLAKREDHAHGQEKPDVRDCAPQVQIQLEQEAQGHLVFHPTQKPLGLISWLLGMVVPPGGVVLDPFAGSGTTPVAAKALGISWVAIDKGVEYCAMIRRRLEHADADIPLFITPDVGLVTDASAELVEPAAQGELF